MDNACIILNQHAGSATAAEKAVVDYARDRGVPLVALGRGNQAADAAREAVSAGATHLVIAGGDGTIHHVVNAVADHLDRLTFGIIPLGTGNDLSRCLDLPRDDPVAAIELALAGQPRAIDAIAYVPMDTPWVRGFSLPPSGAHAALCLNLISGGFESLDSQQVDSGNKKRFGPFAYWFAAARKLSDIIAHRVTLTSDGHRETIDAFGLALANGRYLGGGFRIAPQALLDDGLLDLVLFPVQSSLELLSAGIDTLLNRQEESDKILFRQAAGIEIAAVPPVSFRADGEPLGEVNLVCEVRPQALRVVCGQQPHCVTDPPPPLQKGE